jgi:hypothetical protein
MTFLLCPAECTLPFTTNQYISSKHCTISKLNDAISITDHSTNGTLLNGKRLEKNVAKVLALSLLLLIILILLLLLLSLSISLSSSLYLYLSLFSYYLHG